MEQPDFFSIPIFIISYNRLRDLRMLVERLERDGYVNIHIVDNASTDLELISYLEASPHTVHRLGKNWGPYVVWESHLFDDVVQNQWYVVTDPDVIPVEECPADYVQYFYEILQTHPEKTKVGFGLKLDDIPEEYKYKYDIWRFESFYWDWEKRLQGTKSVLYDAPIDTTFALYRPGMLVDADEAFYAAFRTGAPYIARHLGWYTKENDMSRSEQAYYLGKNKGSTAHDHNAMLLYRQSVIHQLLRSTCFSAQEISDIVAVSLTESAKNNGVAKTVGGILLKPFRRMVRTLQWKKNT